MAAADDARRKAERVKPGPKPTYAGDQRTRRRLAEAARVRSARGFPPRPKHARVGTPAFHRWLDSLTDAERHALQAYRAERRARKRSRDGSA